MVTVLDLIKHVSTPTVLVVFEKTACAYMLSRKDSPIAYTSLSFPLTEKITSREMLIEPLLHPSPNAVFGLKDFPHVNTALLARYLNAATQARSVGTSVLLYGDSGTGKTELSRALAKHCGRTLYEIRSTALACNYADDEFNSRFPNKDRLRYLSLLNSLLTNKSNAMMLVDECEGLFENVETTLNAMKDSNYLLAVATGKSRDGLDRSLRLSGLADMIDISITAEETASKSNPQMLLELINYFDVSPTAALMVGDSKYDLEMAQNVPIVSIGVTYGVHERSILIKHSPIACVDDFEEIQFHVNRYFAEKN